MRPVRICIYGGNALKGEPPRFISTLAYSLLKAMPSVIVTGGFYRFDKDRDVTSTDVAALQGAQRYATETRTDLKDCYQAWIPDPELEDHAHTQGAGRMSDTDGITLQVAAGRTPLGRRLAMVSGVDLVITISGRRHTEVVVEQALELGVPVLPIPHAGGDSTKLLKKYRSRIEASFAPDALDRCLRLISGAINRDLDAAASAVVDLLRTAKVGRCLVLMPYDRTHNRLYASTIEPAVAGHMIPVRLDRLPKSDAIYTNFAEAILASSAVIIDITKWNENVMYEIGYAHGRGLTPLIYTRKKQPPEGLPIYIRNLNVRLASKSSPVTGLIDEYLRSAKVRPRLH